MTLKPGEIVEANVTSAEVYGVYLQHNHDQILVLIPEVEWVPTVSDCREFVEAGETFPVLILGQADNGVYAGSIKQCDPEGDPWRQPEFTVGSAWCGEVERVYQSSDSVETKGYLIRLPNGLKGLLPAESARRTFERGDTVQVKITARDDNERKLTLAADENDS